MTIHDLMSGYATYTTAADLAGAVADRTAPNSVYMTTTSVTFQVIPAAVDDMVTGQAQ